MATQVPQPNWTQILGGSGGKGGRGKGGSKKSKKKPLTPAQQVAQAQKREEARVNSPTYIKTQVKASVKRKRVEQNQLAASGVDPYVTIRHGQLVTVKNPRNALHVNGQPMTRSQVVSGYQRYNDLWLSYLGRNITAKEFQHFVNIGWSQQQIITQYLVKRPNFTKSPYYKQQAGSYVDAYHQIYGENVDPPQSLIKSAVVSGMSASAFADSLRKRPDYLGSNEFKTNTAQLENVYSKIYGTPDARGENIVKQAALAGWTQDQLAAWLRHQPEYTGSEEFQSKALNFAQAMGMVSGSLPTMGAGPLLQNPNVGGAGPLPTDNRVPVPQGGPNPTSNMDTSTQFQPVFPQ